MKQDEISVKASASPADASGDETDAKLVRAVARGDAPAFRKLTDRHLLNVHRLAARMLGDQSEAEEVTQEAFLKLWTHASRWKPAMEGGSALPWLRTIAINTCIDRLRRRWFDTGNEIPERADEAASAPDQMDQGRLGALVSRALGELSDRQRAAIVLTYYEELSNAEAAVTLDLHLKAFESLLLRARQSLKVALTARGIGPSDLREVA